MNTIIQWVVSRLNAKLFKKITRSLRGWSSTGAQIPAKVNEQIKYAVAASNSRQYDVAEKHLKHAREIDPANPDVAPHLSRVKFLRNRSDNPDTEIEVSLLLETLEKMDKELAIKPIYFPSKFWDKHRKFHVELLKLYGINNFKRTVSHHYQNWLMLYRNDPQVQELSALNDSLVPWFNTIEIPDHVGMHLPLDFKLSTYPLAFADQRDTYRISVGMLWEYVSKSTKILDDLSESEIGNPIRIWKGNKIISSDLAHSVRERNLLLDNLSLNGNEGITVAELGAGHGRIAEVFAKTTNYKYCIFDITPALYVSQWYIKKLFPEEKIFGFRHFENFEDIQKELETCRFAFFTANQIEKLPNEYVQLFINLNSLTEMSLDQIANFLAQIDRVTSEAFLSRQWDKWENKIDGHSVSRSTFSMNNSWTLKINSPDEIHPKFFNQLWYKK